MNNDLPRNNDLREDLFADQEFRETVFRATVQTAKRRRIVHVASRCTFAALLTLGLALQFRGREAGRLAAEVMPVNQSRDVLRSERLEIRIVSAPLSPEQMLTTSAGDLTVVSTESFSSVPVHELTDAQLLSFFPGEPVALIRPDAHQAELLFLGNGPGAKSFSRNN